jgi:hypothetical protein
MSEIMNMLSGEKREYLEYLINNAEKYMEKGFQSISIEKSYLRDEVGIYLKRAEETSFNDEFDNEIYTVIELKDLAGKKAITTIVIENEDIEEEESNENAIELKAIDAEIDASIQIKMNRALTLITKNVKVNKQPKQQNRNIEKKVEGKQIESKNIQDEEVKRAEAKRIRDQRIKEQEEKEKKIMQEAKENAKKINANTLRLKDMEDMKLEIYEIRAMLETMKKANIVKIADNNNVQYKKSNSKYDIVGLIIGKYRDIIEASAFYDVEVGLNK